MNLEFDFMSVFAGESIGESAMEPADRSLNQSYSISRDSTAERLNASAWQQLPAETIVNQTTNAASDFPIVLQVESLSESEQLFHERAIARANTYLVAEADLLETVMEVDQNKFYLKFNLGSTHAYCLKYLKLTGATAYNFINVARKAQEVPQLKEAIDRGDLSVPKARKIVPVVNKQNCETWIGKAISLPKEQLEREVAECNPESAVREEERAKPRSGGRTKLELTVSGDFMRLLRRAQSLASERLKKSAGLAETFAEALESDLDRHDPLRKAARSEQRSVNKNKLYAKPIPKAETNASQSNMPTGRRPILAKVVHQVNLRDQRRCQAKRSDGSMCTSQRYLHLHHIVPVANGGSNEVGNIITLCGSCHRRWHLQ